jgi:hypothetical protein
MSFEILRPGQEAVQPDKPEQQQELADMFTKQVFLRTVTNCPVRKHAYPPAAFTCKHVLEQDREHPEGIIFTPGLFFLCKSCFSRFEQKKLDIQHTLVVYCRKCVIQEVSRVIQIDPAKFANLSEQSLAIEISQAG